MASGQATNTRTDRHVCRPPKGFAPEHGLLWICPDCWSEFIYRPVWFRELNRVINLWVRHYEPPRGTRTPHTRRRTPCLTTGRPRSVSGSTSAASRSC